MTAQATAFIVGLTLCLAVPSQAAADEKSEKAHARSKTAYRRAAPLQVYVTKRGGYSYRAPDVTNSNIYRNPYAGFDRQTPFGPFDSGFFFDSGIMPHGGYAPYQN